MVDQVKDELIRVPRLDGVFFQGTLGEILEVEGDDLLNFSLNPSCQDMSVV